MATFRFFVEGKPVPKARPRVVRGKSGKSWTFTPQRTKDWEQLVAWEVKRQMMLLSSDGPEIRLPFEDRVLVETSFWFDKPKSYPKKLRDHLKKPDLDNLQKSVLDALTGVRLIADDNRVTDLIARKRYTLNGEPEGVVFYVSGSTG